MADALSRVNASQGECKMILSTTFQPMWISGMVQSYQLNGEIQDIIVELVIIPYNVSA